MRASIPMCWVAVVQSAASDWAAARLAVAIGARGRRPAGRGRTGAAERSRHCAGTRGDASMMPALKIERCEQSYTDTDARSAQTYSYGALPVISPDPRAPEDPSRL